MLFSQEDVMTRKRCPHYWPFVRGIHALTHGVTSQMTSDAEVWCSLRMLAPTICSTNHRLAGDLRHKVTVIMSILWLLMTLYMPNHCEETLYYCMFDHSSTLGDEAGSWNPSMMTLWQLSALLTLCEGNPPVSGGFPSQRPSNSDICCFFDIGPEKLTKHSSGQWSEISGRSVRHHCHDDVIRWKHFPRYWSFVREFPAQMASNAGLWCFLWSAPE